MTTLELNSSILIAEKPSENFPFFSDARNLDFLTPDWLHFKIVEPEPIAIEARPD